MEYRFKVIINSNDFKKLNKLRIKDLRIENDKIIFTTTLKYFNIIKNEVEIIEYVDKKIEYKKTFFNNSLIIIGIFFVILTMITLSVSVTKITFTNSSYDKEVYTYLQENVKKIGPFSFLNKSLLDINKDLRKMFYSYEWISISKKGTTLLVNIEKNYEDGRYTDNNKHGNIYSSYDAIITKYHIEKGVVLVQEHQSVNKGDILISGDIHHYDNKVEEIFPQGYVIGEVIEYKKYKIRKYDIVDEATGKIFIDKFISFFDKKINIKNIPFKYYHIKENCKTDLKYIKYIERIYYERDKRRILVDKVEVKKNIENEIIKEIESNNLNKIIYKKCIDFSEDEEYFNFLYIVKSERSIGEFVED